VKKILIVDDEPEFLAILKSTLEIRGFEVTATTNAVEAGLWMATQVPGVILMDIKMPGIDGFQACEAIRRNPATKDIPIIIVSALSDDVYVRKAARMNLAAYFTKPVDMEKLINKIREILGVTNE